MYKSPIELVLGDLSLQLDGETLKAVQQCGFNIDKEELTKALLYDRDQYNKGYSDALETIPKWISVKERLPEEGRYVLVAYETIAGFLCHVSMLWTYATGDYYWDGLHGINPTHWMPLPEPPKDRNHGKMPEM